LYLTKNFV